MARKKKIDEELENLIEEPALPEEKEITVEDIKKELLEEALENNETVEVPLEPKKKVSKKNVGKKIIEKIQEKKNEKTSDEVLIEKIQEKGNLPVYNQTEIQNGFMSIEEVQEGNPKNLRKDKAKREEEEKELQEKIISDDTAAFVEVINDKKGEKKIVRYKPDLNQGLSSEIIEHRKMQGLVNKKTKGSTKTIPAIIFGNIFTFFNLLNFAIAIWIVSAVGVKAFTNMLFVVIVTANLTISIIQEIRSKLTIDKLSILSAPTAGVLRDGDVYDIPVDEVVLDDILYLTSGKQIPSDSILVEGGVEVNESLLTGESDSITKKPGDVLYSGSFVVSGNCKARVDRVGKDNYIEKLTNQAKMYKKPKSDLMHTLKMIIRIVAIIIIPLGVCVFLSQWNFSEAGRDPVWNGAHMNYPDAVLKTSGAIIGMIPSGLFLLTSIGLAVGVIRLAQNNTLVQELYCIEMLARVDVLCLDKTGTITDGSMAVKNVIEYPNDTGVTVKNAISAMQNALNDGNVTSQALEEKFGRAKRIKHKNIIPFSSQRKYSAVEFERYGTFMLGAPEFILIKNYASVAVDVNKAANDGFRVILLAHSDGSIVDGKVEGEILPIALILIEDTIRPDAVETINYFNQSGVEVKVISGDNALTVAKISERAGILNSDKYISLEGLTDKEVIRSAAKFTVFGRVSPAQKKLLVMTLKELGKTVAMTGDGVNDILALKEADCSIALASGSEAARNVSHLVLLDSNFGSMPKVVAEGRRVINNVQKVASLFLTKTIFSFLLAVYCCVINQYPISPGQLFLIDVFVIGIPSFVLVLEPNNNKFHGKFLSNVLKNALPGAIVIAISTAIVFLLSRNVDFLSYQETISIIVINATFTCFMVLYKVCKPFNVLKKALFTVMISVAAILVLLLPNMFDIVSIIPSHLIHHLPNTWPHMGAPALLLLICLMQATYPAIRVVENIRPWIKSALTYLTAVLRKIR